MGGEALINSPTMQRPPTVPFVALAVHVHVHARRHQRLRRLRVPVPRGKVQRGPPAPQAHARAARPIGKAERLSPATVCKEGTRQQPRDATPSAVPFVGLTVHVRARRHQRLRRLRVPLQRRKVQRGPPAPQAHARAARPIGKTEASPSGMCLRSTHCPTAPHIKGPQCNDLPIWMVSSLLVRRAVDVRARRH
jgi:hypothetical protein